MSTHSQSRFFKSIGILKRPLREGFTDYVIKLTDNVESHLQSGETSELIAAQKIAERYFVPAYDEIRRKIESLRIGTGGSILAAGSAFALAAAVQTTPALLTALGIFFGTVLKDYWQKEAAEKTNEKYAFKYIATLQRIVQ